MKTKNLFLLPVLIAGLGLMLAGRLPAQTFTTLHSFTGGSDGAAPRAGLISSGNTLYGTAGTVFAVNTDGTGFTNLHSFAASTTNSSSVYTNSDGGDPKGLILSGNTLYGTANVGGSSGNGTIFKLNTDGTGFTTLHSFAASATNASGVYTNSDGAALFGGVILSGNTLYGTASRGGSSGNGTVFALNIDGTGFTTLHSFTPISGPNAATGVTNSDGAYPQGELVLSGNTLYGTAQFGGSLGNGTVFALNTDGTSFTTLHSFEWPSDGGLPNAQLVLSGTTLYGTAFGGGSSGFGTVFAVHTDGTGFTNLHSFTASFGVSTNRDGTRPLAGLVLSSNTLYGTAWSGGSLGNGTVFAVNTDGTGFTILHSFTGLSEGASPYAGLTLSGKTLSGTTSKGGSSDRGTVFSLSFAPQLTITPSGANVILSWPTNVAGFDYTGYTLQFTTNLVSPVVWTTVSPGPVVLSGQFVVTNPISGAQQFYRLSPPPPVLPCSFPPGTNPLGCD